MIYTITSGGHLGFCMLRPCSLDFPKNNVGNEFLIPQNIDLEVLHTFMWQLQKKLWFSLVPLAAILFLAVPTLFQWFFCGTAAYFNVHGHTYHCAKIQYFVRQWSILVTQDSASANRFYLHIDTDIVLRIYDIHMASLSYWVTSIWRVNI